MDLQIIIPSLKDKIEKYANSQRELCGLLENVRKKAEETLKGDEWEKLLTRICTVEDIIDSIIATKMLQRQNISIEKVFVKYFVIAKGSVKFHYKLQNQYKLLKELNDTLSDEKSQSNSDAAEFPAKASSSNTDPQKKSLKALSKKLSISEAIQVSSGNKDVGTDSSVLKGSDESHHQSWEEGSVPVVLEELVSKLAQPELLSRRMRQLHILKANLKCPSDAIFLWTSYHSYDTEQHFQFRCWVLVSKKSEEKNILIAILKQARIFKQEEFEQSNQFLRKQLHDYLVFKRYLIVLYDEPRDLRDDVWNNLKSAFPYSLNGSRVLLISKGITPTNVSKEWIGQQKSKDYLQEESRILGMKDIMTELSQSILNQYKLLFLISIVGVAESEKTTFLWATYNAEDITKQFQYRAWVRVPKKFNEKDLLADILEQVTDNKEEEENRDPVTLQQKLCNFLAPKRYLIVLYDVWTADVWDKLKQALPNSMNGSRVILTVQEANVARETNSSWIFGTVCGKELLHENVSNLKIKHRWGRLSDLKANESGLVGLDDKVQELAELLLDSYQFLISVLGVAGSGKTMIVKEIYNSLAIKQHFNCRAFVSVSQVFEERKLLTDLSMLLGMVRKDESWSKEELQKRLGIFLAWKRYLIVLDDVYTADFWERLSPAFPNSSNGSRVILTTRDARVPRNIKAHTGVIQLRSLNDDESWKLFVKKVPKVVENAELMKALKDEILQRCGGLPLSIVVLGGLLSTKEPTIKEWSKVMQINQKKERKKKATDEDGLNFSGRLASSSMKEENVKNFITGQSNSFTQHDLSDTKLEEKDGKGEIEEIGLGEAKPMQEEEKVKYGATYEDQEHFSNQLASSNTKPKEDNQNTTSPDYDQSDSSDETLSILALGYKDLKPDVKFCLNYLGLFPKSEEVPIRRLFQLLQAEGLVEQETKKEASEDQVKKYIEDLEKRNMIEVVKKRLNGSAKTVCMQSTLYDESSRRTETAGMFHIQFNHDEQNNSKQPEFIRRFAGHPEINYNSLLKCSFQLRSYISFKTERGDLPTFGVDKLLKKIVKGGFGLIVILDLENVYKPVLSKHLGKFPNLKYLGLRWTFLDSIPDSVGDLPCLETLDVKHTNISTLPGELWKAEYLQHLYMNNICVDTSIAKIRQKNGLANLKTLSGLVIRNENSIAYLKAARMNGLRKLGVTCSEELIEEIVDWISNLIKLQSLKLRSINESWKSSSLKLRDLSHLEELSELYLFGELKEKLEVKNFPSELESLTLAVSKLSANPMEELGKLKSLKILRLHAHSYMGKTMTCLCGTFLNLRVLELWMLVELEEWKVENGAMPALEDVEIRCCKKLSYTNGLKELTTLKKMLLRSMKQDFVEKLKDSLGSNVSVEEKTDLKFSSTWEMNA